MQNTIWVSFARWLMATRDERKSGKDNETSLSSPYWYSDMTLESSRRLSFSPPLSALNTIAGFPLQNLYYFCSAYNKALIGKKDSDL